VSFNLIGSSYQASVSSALFSFSCKNDLFGLLRHVTQTSESDVNLRLILIMLKSHLDPD